MNDDISQVTLRLKGEIKDFFLKFQKEMGFQTDSQTIIFILGQYMRFIGDDMRLVDLKNAREIYEKKKKIDDFLFSKQENILYFDDQEAKLEEIKKLAEYMKGKVARVEKKLYS